MLKNGATERQNGPSYWLVTRRDAADVDLLTLKLPGGEMVLPVFSLEEEAGMFLWLEVVDEAWQVEGFSVAELVALLLIPSRQQIQQEGYSRPWTARTSCEEGWRLN